MELPYLFVCSLFCLLCGVRNNVTVEDYAYKEMTYGWDGLII